VAWLLLIVIFITLTFGFVIFFGPPYMPTMHKQIAIALDLLNLRPGQTLLELGVGDGRVALAAAQRGLKVVGIELNPLLAIIARLRTWKYRKQVRIVWGNYWRTPWPLEADGIFTFMLQRQMSLLDRRIEAWHVKPVRLASFAFYIPAKKPAAQKAGVFVYDYK
jgi:SAM-dependent methyltransferase